MKRGLSFVAVFSLVTLSCSVSNRPPEEDGEAQEFARAVSVDGLTHEFFVYVPASYDGTPAPLLLLLHGGAGNAENIEETVGMKRKADAVGFLLVRPEGYDPTGSGHRTWNAGACCGRAEADGVDHVAAIRAMLDDVARQWHVDPRRVYATGHSNGGMMAYRLACELPDRVAAVAPNAAVMMTTDLDASPARQVFACVPGRPVPIFHMHGLEDGCVRFEGGRGQGLDRSTRPSVTETIDFWVRNNRCRRSPETTFQNGTATCVTYSGCDLGADVTLCTLASGGHTWPGTDRYPAATRLVCGGSRTDDLIANDAMWAFFLAHPMVE